MGIPIVAKNPESASAQAFLEIAEKIYQDEMFRK
jgi:MinD-like ATPase involved in chromosome partitioning or flagellar assembly